MTLNRVHLMDEQTVQRFWQDHACGDAQVGGLHERFHDDYEKFFTDYDRFRYQNERHLRHASMPWRWPTSGCLRSVWVRDLTRSG